MQDLSLFVVIAGVLRSAYYFVIGLHLAYILFLFSIPVFFQTYFIHHRLLAGSLIGGQLLSNLIFSFRCPLTLLQRKIEKILFPAKQKSCEFLTEITNFFHLPSRPVWIFMVFLVCFDLLILI